MADVAATLAAWSSTTNNNAPAGTTNIGTGLDDNLREIQGVVTRGLSHKGNDIASATTTDLGAVEGLMHDITGTTTITSFGTGREGLLKILQFDGALTLTYHATNLVLVSGGNRVTAAGDIGVYISEGSGNWREVAYFRAGETGAWTSPSFDANNFTGINSMTWTVASGDVATYAYKVIGKIMIVTFSIIDSTVGGTPDTLLQIAIPASKTAAKICYGALFVKDNGTTGMGTCYVQSGAGNDKIYCQKSDGTNWSAATNTTAVAGTIIFEIA